jgi:predicted CoA-binding protein
MTIAIIGASTDRRKYGNKAVRAWLKAGATVVPVNPKAESVEGIPCVPSVLDYRDPIDTASLYVPAPIGVRVIEEIAEKGIAEVYVNPGAESDELLVRAKELGINAMVACSIIGSGSRPDDFGDE